MPRACALSATRETAEVRIPRAPQLESSPSSLQLEKVPSSNNDPTQLRINKCMNKSLKKINLRYNYGGRIWDFPGGWMVRMQCFLCGGHLIRELRSCKPWGEAPSKKIGSIQDVFVSWGCHNKLTSTGWPKITEVYSLTALEARRLKSRYLQVSSSWRLSWIWVAAQSWAFLALMCYSRICLCLHIFSPCLCFRSPSTFLL